MIEPRSSEFARMHAWMTNASHADRLGVAGDLGEQSIWRQFFGTVHELPMEYNAWKNAQLPRRDEWSRVSIVHNVWSMESSRWWAQEAGEGLYDHLRNLSAAAESELEGLLYAIRITVPKTDWPFYPTHARTPPPPALLPLAVTL